jgi:glycosyltransferase involved in cell wall biosynthesis
MNENQIMVSVCMITYNHEKYISQAIEGVIMQQTSFPIELIIGEDCSTDNTRKICIEYQKKYPEIIKLRLPESNIGIIHNFLETMLESKGKYIAICEGDDYWTDPLKLQRQIEFLKQNQEFSACCHQTKVIYESNIYSVHDFATVNSNVIKLSDILNGRIFHTASVVFKSEIIKKHPLPLNILSADRALNFLLVSFGSIYFFKESMCVYRKNDDSISNTVTYAQMLMDLNMIPWIMDYNPSFPRLHYLSFIHKSIALYSKKISLTNKVKHLSFYFILSFSFFPYNLKEMYLKFKNK